MSRQLTIHVYGHDKQERNQRWPYWRRQEKMTLPWTKTVAISKIVLLLLIVSPAAEMDSATKLLELARARFGELRPAEEDLFRAVANGEPKDCSDPLGKHN